MESNIVVDWEYEIKKKDEEIERLRSELNEIKSTEEFKGELKLHAKDLKILTRLRPLIDGGTAFNLVVNIPIEKCKCCKSKFEIDWKDCKIAIDDDSD
jgi:hypothetical protein